MTSQITQSTTPESNVAFEEKSLPASPKVTRVIDIF